MSDHRLNWDDLLNVNDDEFDAVQPIVADIIKHRDHELWDRYGNVILPPSMTACDRCDDYRDYLLEKGAMINPAKRKSEATHFTYRSIKNVEHRICDLLECHEEELELMVEPPHCYDIKVYRSEIRDKFNRRRDAVRFAKEKKT